MGSFVQDLGDLPLRGRLSSHYRLAPLTWFQTGGQVTTFFRPYDTDDLALFLRHKISTPLYILGAGSNVLIRDGLWDACVIKLGKFFAEVHREDCLLVVGAGALDRTVANIALQEGLSGMEFLVGIPGNIGGAIAMNAGAYGSEITDILEWVDIMHSDGRIERLYKIDATYRHANLPEGAIVLRVALRGQPKGKNYIQAMMEDFLQKKHATQPMKGRTGGSTFKNPPGCEKKAWELIDMAGCRGLQLGQAQISPLHCNFMMNLGGATALDIESLGDQVQERVFEKTGIKLEWEIKKLGNHSLDSGSIMNRVEEILSYYNGAPAGVKKNLYTLLMQGRLNGSGNIVILPVDQGIEHGPAPAFNLAPNGYHPHAHFKRAIDLGLSAYAAPLGWLEASSDVFAGQVPTILKLNHNNKLIDSGTAPYPAWTASVQDALRLGCSAVGITIYPGSDMSNALIQEASEVIAEASSVGLPSVVWSYPRGAMEPADETALDIIAYGAHIAATIGAHVIKVKLPSDHIVHNRSLYEGIPTESLSDRVKHVVQCAFDGRRIITFSGGDKKDDAGVLEDVRAIIKGGGFGSMMGRNIFQRPIESARDLTQKIIDLYCKR